MRGYFNHPCDPNPPEGMGHFFPHATQFHHCIQQTNEGPKDRWNGTHFIYPPTLGENTTFASLENLVSSVRPWMTTRLYAIHLARPQPFASPASPKGCKFSWPRSRAKLKGRGSRLGSGVACNSCSSRCPPPRPHELQTHRSHTRRHVLL